MSTMNWNPVHRVDQARLSAARVQAHVAVQWLARAAYAYIPAQPDACHSNLGWDDGFDGLVTHALPDGMRLGLNVSDLALAILDGASAAPSLVLPLDGAHDAEVRAWLGRQ